jgi:hypothetical protein
MILFLCVWGWNMTKILRVPTENELAEISLAELNKCVKSAYLQWQEAIRLDKNTTETKQIFCAYDNEQLKRLKHIKKAR